jgi:hypothetical protein
MEMLPAIAAVSGSSAQPSGPSLAVARMVVV